MEINVITVLRILLVVFYLFAGVNHFVDPDFYFGLIPDYVPFPEFINYASGFAEILLAVGVLIPKWRLTAVKGIIFLLVLFIPSHIYFIQQGSCIEGGLCVPQWLGWFRLLVIHPLLMLWAWTVRKT